MIQSVRLRALTMAALVAAIAVVYAGVWNHSFIAMDDPRYVTENPAVRAGLTGAGVAWAFTTFHASNWHPLTWLSHMLDVELFGVSAGSHHLVNVAIHTANALLLVSLLHAATGAWWRSAAVAALFAVHPLHVESVAWISERKDVLSTSFWLICSLAYVGWVRQGGRRRYAVVVGSYALGLAAKPMLVTLPLTLLLLDAWPLGRFSGRRLREVWPLVREKLPLFALAAASAVVTLCAQASGGALSSLRLLTVHERVASAALAYAGYLRQTLWPTGLAAFYPHPAWTPGGIAAVDAWIAVGVLLLVTGAAVLVRRRAPALVVGWAWFLITLLPVIGLLQVGAQARADRYTYVPLIGIFFGLLFAVPDLSRTRLRLALPVTLVVAIAAAAASARAQVSYWRDTTTLFRRAVEVTSDNWFSWRILGVEQLNAGQPREALASLREAARSFPDSFDVWMSLGTAASASGEHTEAARAFARALEFAPRDATAWFSLGMASLEAGAPRDAARAFARAVALDPRHAGAWTGAALANALLGNEPSTLAARSMVEKLDPDLAADLAVRLQALVPRARTAPR